MNQLMTHTSPNPLAEKDSPFISLKTGTNESHDDLNLSTASMEDLSKLVVTEMITSVREDLRNILAKENSSKDKSKKTIK